MNDVFGYAVWFAQICAGLAMLNATIRLFIGPAAQDRILALERRCSTHRIGLGTQSAGPQRIP